MLPFLPVNRSLPVINNDFFALFQHFDQIRIFRHPAALYPGNVLLHAEDHVALIFVIADVSHGQVAAGVKLAQHPLLRIHILTKFPRNHLLHCAFGIAAEQNQVIAVGDGCTLRPACAGRHAATAQRSQQQDESGTLIAIHRVSSGQRCCKCKPCREKQWQPVTN